MKSLGGCAPSAKPSASLNEPPPGFVASGSHWYVLPSNSRNTGAAAAVLSTSVGRPALTQAFGSADPAVRCIQILPAGVSTCFISGAGVLFAVAGIGATPPT